MNRRKPPPKPKKMVWRMTERAPKGEWVDPDLIAAAAAAPGSKDSPEVSSGGWVLSSFDLLSGTEISDSPGAVPDDLFDEMFPPPGESPKPSSE